MVFIRVFVDRAKLSKKGILITYQERSHSLGQRSHGRYATKNKLIYINARDEFAALPREHKLNSRNMTANGQPSM